MFGKFFGSGKLLGRLLDGRYQIVEALGKGGFGQTYIALDTRRPGRPKCVVKHLKPASNDSQFLQVARRLFTNEAETLEQVGSHDQIPRLLAYFEEGQEFYLVQEFIEGHLLSAELPPKHCWTEDEVIQLLQQVLGILEFIHRQGVIHRDIKPDNIIRRQRDNRLVLIDFGAVKQIQTQLATIPGQTNMTVAIGTPGYMAMEQGHGNPRPNSDIYALGMIGLQVLTGLSPRSIEKDPRTGEIIWQYGNIRPELASILTKMVHSHFRHRYQSATEVLQALKQIAPVELVTKASEVPKQLYEPHETQESEFEETPVAEPGVLLSELQRNLSSSLVLSAEEYSHLESMLVEYVGTIAPILLEQVSAQAFTLKELLEKLVIQLPKTQKAEFESRVKYLLQGLTADSQLKSSRTASIKDQVIDESFVQECERELADLIGPIAAFLVQKALKSSPQVSRVAFVEILAAEIKDSHKAAQFRQRLLS